jgi:hypothetical protein
MKKAILWVVVFGLLVPALGRSQDAAKKLTNQDVIDMVGLGLSDDVVIGKIQSSAASNSLALDTSIDGLKALKAAKVSDAVIKVMVNPAAAAPPVAQPGAPMEDPNMPPKEIGIYLRDGAKWVPIEGQNVSQAKMGGKLSSGLTMGFKAKRWKAFVEGKTSQNRVAGDQVFYIYCPDGMSGSDYKLIKLQEHGDRREFDVGSVGGFGGGKSGISESSEIDFKAERIASRTYKVTLAQPLKGGEYGFFMGAGQSMAMSGNVAGGSAQGRIYDFSIPD